MLAMIVAVASNDVIGKDNDLIWHIPEDLKYFKSRTTGHTILMGRNTLESLPFALPNRTHWVLTSQEEYVPPFPNVKVFTSLETMLEEASKEELVYCIGGAMMYKAMSPYADRLYVTELDRDFVGDVTFTIHKQSEWQEIERIPGIGHEGIGYDFVTYTRKV